MYFATKQTSICVMCSRVYNMTSPSWLPHLSFVLNVNLLHAANELLVACVDNFFLSYLRCRYLLWLLCHRCHTHIPIPLAIKQQIVKLYFKGILYFILFSHKQINGNHTHACIHVLMIVFVQIVKQYQMLIVFECVCVCVRWLLFYNAVTSLLDASVEGRNNENKKR